MKLYPEPTSEGDPITHQNNLTKNLLDTAPSYHYDFKIDHVFTDKHRIFGRYGRNHSTDNNPAYASYILGASTNTSNAHNAVISYDWTPSPTSLWTSRIGVDRWYTRTILQDSDLSSVGLPSYLAGISGLKRMSPFQPDNYYPIVGSSCADTTETHTQWMYSSSFSKVIGSHSLKFGFEQRQFLNNFFQPCDVNGAFFFGKGETVQDIFNPSDAQGNDIASLLLGWPYSASIGTVPPTSNKSKDTGFFIQDDWKVNNRLTLNLGLRYEWSTPYTERYDRLAWNDYFADSGVDVPGVGELKGISRFASPEKRTVDSDRNNFGPRLGFAYRLGQNMTLRGGAGVYFAFNPATNFQYVADAWNWNTQFIFTKDGGITRYATLSDPLPNGLGSVPGPKYGPLSSWGFSNFNHLSDTFRNGEVYQWNLGIQRELPGNMLIDVNYSANRSTHMPDNSNARNRNIISIADREKWGSAGLSENVSNPFQSLFVGPDAIFNEPTSIYNDPEIPRRNLLRPYPQFDGAFWGLSPMDANIDYHSLQIRFEKRYSHGLNFTGNYTFSKLLDTSSEGFNAWMGNIRAGRHQDFNNRNADRSVGSSDTPQRLAFAVSYEVPVGRGRPFGKNMSRAADAIVGGWKINSFVTFQSGNPIAVRMNTNRLTDGQQRPNVSGDPTRRRY